MKPDSSIQSDAALHQALRQWKVSAQLPPRFQEQVWRQIERDQAGVRAPAWAPLWHRLSAALGRPSLAASYVTVLLLAGVSAGYWQVRITRVQMEENLSARYVHSVDPLLASSR